MLLVSGDVEPAAARKLAEAAFGDWQGAGDGPSHSLPEPPAAAATHIYLVDQPGAIQSQIRIGQRGPRRDRDDRGPREGGERPEREPEHIPAFLTGDDE